MFKSNPKTNDVALKELNAYAEKHKKPLETILLSDEYLADVAEIFYKHMPKMVKFAMKKEKFQDFYKNHREQFVATIKSR